MNYRLACEILEITIENVGDDVPISTIKKKYRVKALLYHPDKNKAENAALKFQEVQNAYEYLIKHNDYVETAGVEQPKTYQTLLFSFLKNILGDESRNQVFYTLLQRLSNNCEEKTMRTLEQLDKNILIKIYEIASKYSKVLHFGEGILEKIEKIIKERIKNDECIILNPTLEDLFDNNLYKLRVGDFTYIVPLWHHELVYDNSGNDIIVKCFPVLDENIYIDELNNIHVEIELSLHEIWGKEMHSIRLGNREVNIIPKSLKLTNNQTVVFLNEGISMVNTKDVYNISKNSNIYVHIDMYL